MDPAADHRERDSLRVAANALIDSKRFAKYAIWFVTVVVPATISWYSSKLDTQRELNELTKEVSVLTGKAAALELHIDDARTTAAKADLIIEAEIQYAQRNALRAYAIALAHESAKLRAKKLDASVLYLNAFDRRTLTDKDRASAAAEEVITKIALP